jgi:Protein of unknown function (DUF3606)
MPIRKYIGGSVFGPETIAHMMSAFESARTILNLNDPNDPMVETVAKKVVSLASQGITDPAQITRLIVADSNKERGATRQIRIDIRDDYELRYWTKKLGVTKDQLEAAIREVGTNAEDVAIALRKPW